VGGVFGFFCGFCFGGFVLVPWSFVGISPSSCFSVLCREWALAFFFPRLGALHFLSWGYPLFLLPRCCVAAYPPHVHKLMVSSFSLHDKIHSSSHYHLSQSFPFLPFLMEEPTRFYLSLVPEPGELSQGLRRPSPSRRPIFCARPCDGLGGLNHSDPDQRTPTLLRPC